MHAWPFSRCDAAIANHFKGGKSLSFSWCKKLKKLRNSFSNIKNQIFVWFNAHAHPSSSFRKCRFNILSSFTIQEVMLLTKCRAKQSTFHPKNNILNFWISKPSRCMSHGQKMEFRASTSITEIGNLRKVNRKAGAGGNPNRWGMPHFQRFPLGLSSSQPRTATGAATAWEPHQPMRQGKPGSRGREQRRGHAGTHKRGPGGPTSPSALLPAPGAAGAVPLSRGRLPGQEGTGQRQQAAAWAGGLSRLTPAGPRIPVTMLFLLSAVWKPPDWAVPLGCPAEHPSDTNLPGERRAEEPGGNPLETTKNIT